MAAGNSAVKTANRHAPKSSGIQPHIPIPVIKKADTTPLAAHKRAMNIPNTELTVSAFT